MLLCAGCATTPTVKTGPIKGGPKVEAPAETPPPNAGSGGEASKPTAKKAKEAPKRPVTAEFVVSLAAIREDAALKARKEQPENHIRMLDETRQLYQEALKIDPEYNKAQEGLVRVYTQMGDHHKAQELLRKALDKNPNDARLWQELGMTYNRQKNAEEALRCFQKALAIDPENRQHMRVIGYTLVWSGRVNEGVPHLVRSLGKAQAHYNVAGVLARQNRLEEAQQHLQIALEDNPRFERAQQMLSALRSGSPVTPAPDLTPALSFLPVD